MDSLQSSIAEELTSQDQVISNSSNVESVADSVSEISSLATSSYNKETQNYYYSSEFTSVTGENDGSEQDTTVTSSSVAFTNEADSSEALDSNYSDDFVEDNSVFTEVTQTSRQRPVPAPRPSLKSKAKRVSYSEDFEAITDSNSDKTSVLNTQRQSGRLETLLSDADYSAYDATLTHADSKTQFSEDSFSESQLKYPDGFQGESEEDLEDNERLAHRQFIALCLNRIRNPKASVTNTPRPPTSARNNSRQTPVSKFCEKKLKLLMSKTNSQILSQRGHYKKLTQVNGSQEWREISTHPDSSHCVSVDVMNRLKLDNLMAKMKMITDLEEHSIQNCMQCRENAELVTEKQFLKSKLNFVSNKIIEDKLKSLNMYQDPVSMIGECARELPRLGEPRAAIMARLLQSLNRANVTTPPPEWVVQESRTKQEIWEAFIRPLKSSYQIRQHNSQDHEDQSIKPTSDKDAKSNIIATDKASAVNGDVDTMNVEETSSEVAFVHENSREQDLSYYRKNEENEELEKEHSHSSRLERNPIHSEAKDLRPVREHSDSDSYSGTRHMRPASGHSDSDSYSETRDIRPARGRRGSETTENRPRADSKAAEGSMGHSESGASSERSRLRDDLAASSNNSISRESHEILLQDFSDMSDPHRDSESEQLTSSYGQPLIYQTLPDWMHFDD